MWENSLFPVLSLWKISLFYVRSMWKNSPFSVISLRKICLFPVISLRKNTFLWSECGKLQLAGKQLHTAVGRTGLMCTGGTSGQNSCGSKQSSSSEVTKWSRLWNSHPDHKGIASRPSSPCWLTIIHHQPKFECKETLLFSDLHNPNSSHDTLGHENNSCCSDHTKCRQGVMVPASMQLWSWRKQSKLSTQNFISSLDAKCSAFQKIPSRQNPHTKTWTLCFQTALQRNPFVTFE